MTAKMDKVLSTAVNIAILVVAVCFVIVVAQRLIDRHRAQAGRMEPEKGQSVSLAGLPASSSGRTLVVGMQIHCHYCEDSLPFYRKLSAEAAGTGTHLVFVFPDSLDSAKAFLAANHVEAGDVRSEPLSDLHIGGTPTVLLLDSQQKVTDFWVGRLPESDEAKVEAQLK